MGTLTLARYALELSLMSLHFCRISESKIAAACLLLAKRMKGTSNEWVKIILKIRKFKFPVSGRSERGKQLHRGRAGTANVGTERNAGEPSATVRTAPGKCVPQIQP